MFSEVPHAPPPPPGSSQAQSVQVCRGPADGPELQHLGPHYSSTWGLYLTFPGKAAPWPVDDSGVLRRPKHSIALARGFSSFPKSLSQPVTHLQPPPPKRGSSELLRLLLRERGIWPLWFRQARLEPPPCSGGCKVLLEAWADSSLSHSWLRPWLFCVCSPFCALGTLGEVQLCQFLFKILKGLLSLGS